MLKQLLIHNFAIIDRLELEFGAGMTVFSGETGAGKSILIDALGMLLGDRADSDAVREGADRAEIDAEFDLADVQAARDWLREHDFEDPDHPAVALIRRVLSREGRTRAYINSRPATARDLKALGELLVDIHGQHAHQSLMRPQTQLELLDAFAVDAALRRSVADTAAQYRALQRRMGEVGGGEDGEQRADFLRYQVSELEALGLGESEVEELEAEQRRLANAERLLQDSQHAYALLYESETGAVADLLGQAKTLLEGLTGIEPAFRDAEQMVSEAVITVDEAASALRQAADNMELDPERLSWVESRLGSIFDLARKHRVDPGALADHLLALRGELDQLEGASERLEQMRQESQALAASYAEQAARLSGARREAGEKLAGEVTRAIRDLGMPEGQFQVRIQPREDDTPRSRGRDDVEFCVSANPGQPPQPLAKVASGGELSRISLAIEVIAAGDRVPTLIFDEVDTGIGGGVAEMVGLRLKALGRGGQVMCVTHLAQVAALGHHHFQVSKHSADGHTRTHIHSLSKAQRVEELARMLGGLTITSQTRAHAREMMENAADS